MKTKILGALFVVTAAAVGLYACAGTTPPPPCNMGHGEYAAKYILESGTGSCAELVGESIGVDKYYLVDGGTSIVSIQPGGATVSCEVDAGSCEADVSTNRYAIGSLKSEIPEGDRCFVNNVEAITRGTAPDRVPLLADGGRTEDMIDAGMELDAGALVFDENGDPQLELTPSEPLTYEFGDLEFFNIAMAPSAQQFKTTLKYTQGSCTATYKVIAMYPAVPCYQYDPDTGDPLYEADGTYKVDPAACEPFEDYDAGRIYGSGIFHEFETFCDGKTGLCQLVADDIGPGTLKKQK